MVFISTDGSFMQNPERCGFGAYIRDDQTEIWSISGYTTEERYLKSWNISSELIAAILGVAYASVKGVREVTLYYDYTGVENFVTGSFKAKSEISKLYLMIMKYFQYVVGMQIHFVKVKGHSGHIDNEIADSLAGRYDSDRTEWLRGTLEFLRSTIEGGVMKC